MDFLGSIKAPLDPPGIDRARWMRLITTHPNLRPAPQRVGINPFTRKPMTFRPHPDFAWVVIAGNQAGTMDWAQDGSNQISVWGESSGVDEIARQVAAQLGGTYRAGEG